MAQRRTSPPQRYRVALLIETSTSWGAQIVRGIGDYAHQFGPWYFYVEPRGRSERLRLPTGWQGDGIIARVTSQSLCNEIVAAGLPAVNVSWFDFGRDAIPTCTVDEAAVGQIAAEYFHDRGFRHFAYCGPLQRPGYTDRLQSSFVETIEQFGQQCRAYRSRSASPNPKSWQTELTHLGGWLSQQPRPLAVLAWSAARGRHVTEACQYAGLRVPEEVAVLGGEFDELMSTMSSPLSTIDVSAHEVGYAAAAMLAKRMGGGRMPRRPQLIPPTGVITRQSTDTTAVDDPLLAKALVFIREQADRGIQVDDILRHLSLSHRQLEQRFAKVLGRSPAAEIRRTRIRRAERLLADTDLPIPQVAAASGFAQPEALTRTFRRELGITPSVYRRQHR